MKDEQIVQLYWDRNPEAITVTANKYGKYCISIARNILQSEQDCEECVNDTYLRAWNVMPPQRPAVLTAFLGKITRNLAIDRYRHESAEKRGGNLKVSLEELKECIADGKGSLVEDEIAGRELTEVINVFLSGLPQKKRILFVRRYWYFDSVSDIAKRVGMTEGNVSVNLKRIREKLRYFLIERGFEI